MQARLHPGSVRDTTEVASFRLGDAPYSVTHVNQDDPAFGQITRYTQARFLDAYGARPIIHAPHFLTIRSGDGQIVATAGLRGAADEPLFLEQYLGQPVERAIHAISGHDICRSEIIEIAHLACSKRGMSRFLFVAMTALLVQWQYRWIAFTGTKAVRHIFDSLNMAPVTLAPADPRHLPDQGQSWGRYYDQEPHVMVGEIAGGHDTLIKTRTYELLNLSLQEGRRHAVA